MNRAPASFEGRGLYFSLSLRWGMAYLAMSLRAFKGRTLTTRRAGLALNICSCLVKGLMPLRALVAGLLTMVIFMRPGRANTPGPFLPTARSICDAMASRTDPTCLRDSSVAVATAVRISLLVADLAAIT